MYLDLDSAQEAAREINRDNLERGWTRPPVGPYPCGGHRGWHIGRAPSPRNRGVPALRGELGDRAWKNLAAENQSNRRRRYRVLVGRVMAAEIRRWREDEGSDEGAA